MGIDVDIKAIHERGAQMIRKKGKKGIAIAVVLFSILIVLINVYEWPSYT